jgi:hypothetical protein
MPIASRLAVSSFIRTKSDCLYHLQISRPHPSSKVEVLLLSCPVNALRASLDAARTTEGAAFRPPDGFLFSLSNV